MIRPRTLWLPVAALVALSGMLGAVAGLRAAARGETPVIEAVASRHLARAGQAARATDCQARPGSGWMSWLVVTCRTDGLARDYHVNRLGWIVRETAPAALPET
ncbi:MAG: hypothetical protein KF887_10350 [Paracoccaceae bacterium]|nr:MAG: hypothetical protein KF887_10350 [Paracoccaceae bacterium]